MATTINRQLSLFVKGILEKHSIDNLQREIDLVAGLQRMWTEGGKDPEKLAKLREEILAAMLGQGAFQNELAEMEKRVKAAMGLSLDGRSRYEDMLKLLVKMDKKGQTVEQFAKWCKENPYDAPKFFKIAEKPDLLEVNWSMAFQTATLRVAEPDSGDVPVSY